MESVWNRSFVEGRNVDRDPGKNRKSLNPILGRIPLVYVYGGSVSSRRDSGISETETPADGRPTKLDTRGQAVPRAAISPNAACFQTRRSLGANTR